MKVGIIALGSSREHHGAALPLDTDTKIAEYIAKEATKETNAEFLGTLNSAYELPEIETGEHQTMNELIGELKDKIEWAKAQDFEGIVLVNAHGGNQKLEEYLEEIEKETKVELKMDSTVCRIEGPHAGTGELSIGSIIGITDESSLDEHLDLKNYPEVGFAGMEKVRKKYDWAEEHAQDIVKEGVEVDKLLGRLLLGSSIASAINRIYELKSIE